MAASALLHRRTFQGRQPGGVQCHEMCALCTEADPKDIQSGRTGIRPEVLKECHYNAIEDKVVKLLPHSSMIGMIFERDIHYRVVESKNHGLLQHDPFSWLVKDDHFVDVGDIYESQKIMNEALNEWILSLNEEQVRTFVDTLYQVISASQADDLITFTADWKRV